MRNNEEDTAFVRNILNNRHQYENTEIITDEIQDYSKLFSWFPWPINGNPTII
jgi:hypothetical protein